MPRTVTIPAVPEQTWEMEIASYTHDVRNRRVTVAHGRYDRSRSEFPPQVFTTTTISGRDYDDLMAADGNGHCPGKPAGTYRIEDLWAFLSTT